MSISPKTKPQKLYPNFAHANAHVRGIRGSGLSLATALHTLAVAVAHPGEYVAVKDHDGGNDEYLMGLIIELRNCMHLELIVDHSVGAISTAPRGVRGAAPYVSR